MKKYSPDILDPAREIFETARDFYTSPEVQEALSRKLYQGNLVLIGRMNGRVSLVKESHTGKFRDILKRYGEGGWNDPEKLTRLLREWSVFDDRDVDFDGGITIHPDGFRLVGIGSYVNDVNDGLLDPAIKEEVARLKGKDINGKHYAAMEYARRGNAAITGSKGGSSLITIIGNGVVPELTVYRPSGESDFHRYVRESNPCQIHEPVEKRAMA